jgi:hypothetical protein
LKFEGDSAMGRALAHVMQHAPGIEPALEEAQWVVPMPLSSERLRERGFNQALVLARHLGPRKTLDQALLRIIQSGQLVTAVRAHKLALVEEETCFLCGAPQQTWAHLWPQGPALQQADGSTALMHWEAIVPGKEGPKPCKRLAVSLITADTLKSGCKTC